MDMLDLARTRYTCKHYDPTRGIAPETLGRLAEILRLSASSVNIQPWRFVFLATPKAKARLMPAVKDFNIERVEHAPLIILFLAKDRLDEAHLKNSLRRKPKTAATIRRPTLRSSTPSERPRSTPTAARPSRRASGRTSR